LVDEAGKIIRISPEEVRTMGRQARGVRLIRLDVDQKLSSVVAFEDTGYTDKAEIAAHLAVPEVEEMELPTSDEVPTVETDETVE
jgi:DNA gyrase/topoisomerase IV subunit A